MAGMVSAKPCFVCGIEVFQATAIPPLIQWTSEARAGKSTLAFPYWPPSMLTKSVVYRTSSTDVRVTGVGRHDNPGVLWRAPRDPTLRWDDIPPGSEDDFVQIPVMKDRPANGVHGFILHESCWKIVQKASGPEGFSLERLLCVCESLPFAAFFDGVDWGHDYGGLIKLDVDNQYPRPPLTAIPISQRVIGLGAMKGPFYEAGFQIMTQPRTALLRNPDPRQPPIMSHGGPLSRLPWELLEMISWDLPTRDALNLRLASRRFQPLFYSAGFWASRFRVDGERDFLFEAREATPSWDAARLLHLYRDSRHPAATPELRNRARVWKLARLLVPMIRPFSPSNTSRDSTDSFRRRQTRSSSSTQLVRLAANEQPPIQNLDEWEAFTQGCRSTGTVEIDVPYGDLEIGIAVVDMGDRDYVTGIKFVDRNGREHIVGRMFNRTTTMCDLKTLYGFRVAMGAGGIRALSVLGYGRYSDWVGRPEGVPQSERLRMDTPVTRLSATFDVSLAGLIREN